MINKSILYSLSMAIGSADGLHQSTKKFVKALVENEVCTNARLWIQKAILMPASDVPIGQFDLLAVASDNAENPQPIRPAQLMDHLLEHGFIENPPPNLLPLPEAETRGSRFVVSLGEYGFLELVFLKESKGFLWGSRFTKADYEELVPIFDKFVMQLRRDASVFNKELYKEKQIRERSELTRLLVKKDFQRRIVATLSHEFRNPLNIIMGYLDLLSETQLDKEQKEYLEIITDTSLSLYYTVKKVFQFANLTLGQNLNETVPFSLQALLGHVDKAVAPMLAKKRVAFKKNVDAALEFQLLGDASKLNDVLIYLLDNAIKFTAKGEVALSVNLLTDAGDSMALQFVVEDTGIGISDFHQEQIFQFFGQEDDSITRHYGGLGLGLSIANEYVAQMGGTLLVLSEKDKGTKITINLPFQKNRNKKHADVQQVFEMDDSKTRNIKVLLVDDDAYQRDMGAKILKNWDLHQVENGLEAVRFLEKNTDTQVVLMDIRMPVLDGISATRLIRQDLKSKALVIAVSGEVQEATIEECLMAGMDCFVPKPYDKNLLLRTIVDKLHVPELIVKQEESPRSATRLDGLNALIVEDNRMIQLLTSRHMKDLGCSYDLAEDGEAAMTLFDMKSYDFVLLDLYLPDIDGFELARAMRQIHPDSCIIAYSGDDSDETRENCKQSGIDGLLLKNYQKSDELALNINAMLQKRQVQQLANPYVNENIFKLDAVLAIIGNDPNDLRDIIQSFVSYTQQMMKVLDEALQEMDRQTIKKTAHSLKSSARQFEMGKQAKQLETIEHEIEKMSETDIIRSVKEVSGDFELALEQMKKMGLWG